MEEIWKDVFGYEGLYQVSNIGRVKSLTRIVDRGDLPSRIQKERIMKQSIGGHGYYVVNLTKNSKQKVYSVHYLVASSFLGERLGLDTNHIDRDKLNNNVSNLEYVSRRENTSHGKSRKNDFPGISFTVKTKKWRANPVFNGKILELGYFSNKEDAISCVKKFYEQHNIVNKYA